MSYGLAYGRPRNARRDTQEGRATNIKRGQISGAKVREAREVRREVSAER